MNVSAAFGITVSVDPASAHRWDELAQRGFLERTLAALRDELRSGFDDLSIHIFSPTDPGVRPASADLRHPNKVLLYLSDETSSEPVALGRSYRAVFKAYLAREVPGTNVFPLSIGYVGDPPQVAVRKPADRDIGVFFSGNLHANRAPLYQACHPRLRFVPPLPRSVWRLLLRAPVRLRLAFDTHGTPRDHVRFTRGFMTGLDPAAYWSMLADSRVVLCPPGFVSAETFRHVEALRAGAVIVTQAMPDTHLYRGAPFVVVADWREGLARARALARDADDLARRQAAGLAWYEAHLSEGATARFIAATLAGLSAAPSAR